jgi:hypothetical protein
MKIQYKPGTFVKHVASGLISFKALIWALITSFIFGAIQIIRDTLGGRGYVKVSPNDTRGRGVSQSVT